MSFSTLIFTACSFQTSLQLFISLNINFVAPEKPDPPVVGKVTFNSIELYWNQECTEDTSGGRLRFCVQEEEEEAGRGFGNVYK